MKHPPQVALIIETSVIYDRRVLAGVARYLRSHHRWSVFLAELSGFEHPEDMSVLFKRETGQTRANMESNWAVSSSSACCPNRR